MCGHSNECGIHVCKYCPSHNPILSMTLDILAFKLGARGGLAKRACLKRSGLRGVCRVAGLEVRLVRNKGIEALYHPYIKYTPLFRTNPEPYTHIYIYIYTLQFPLTQFSLFGVRRRGLKPALHCSVYGCSVWLRFMVWVFVLRVIRVWGTIACISFRSPRVEVKGFQAVRFSVRDELMTRRTH